jgi:hypothetical protein
MRAILLDCTYETHVTFAPCGEGYPKSASFHAFNSNFSYFSKCFGFKYNLGAKIL